MYRRTGILLRESNVDSGNPWQLQFLRMLDMTNDSGVFRTRHELEARKVSLEGNWFLTDSGTFLPLLEAKMVHHYDHRFGDYRDHPDGSENLILPDVPLERLQSPSYATHGRYWVAADEVEERIGPVWSRSWMLGWRDVTKPQNERTVVASLVPRVAVGNKFPLLLSQAEPTLMACLYASLCSFILDYAARQKVGGTSLNFFLAKQFPVPPPTVYTRNADWHSEVSVRDWILPRVLELTYTAWDLEPFARDVGHAGTPFRWDIDRRFHLRCELDAAFFHLYGLSRDDVDYVMGTFPIVRKSDERAHGEYRTKRVILETYDALAKAAQTGKPYRTPLDPLPAAVGASHGSFDPNSTPKDYAEALRMGLLLTLIRRSGEGGIPQGSLSRVLLWLEDAKHAATGLQGEALAAFERVRESDPLLAQSGSEAPKLLQALENEKVITRDAKGIVRLRAGSTAPNWVPQTPTLVRLASVTWAGLEQAETGASMTPAVEEVPIGKAKRV
jgi:hypothetical protein